MPQQAERLQFIVIGATSSYPAISHRGSTAVLRVDNWDDFTYKTMYDVTIWVNGDSTELGAVKILEFGQRGGRPQIPDRFTQLGEEFCSLGQDIEYYEKLMKIPPHVRAAYLHALVDAAYEPVIEAGFRNEPGWTTSFLRFGQAVNALKDGRKLVRGENLSTDRLSFVFEWSSHDSTVELPFEFDATSDLPGRFHALIGYNGVGKTTLLADLAMAARSGARNGNGDYLLEPYSRILGSDRTFGAVIAVSYSAFDTFRTPEAIGRFEQDDNVKNSIFGYAYCGLRRRIGPIGDGAEVFELKSIGEIESEFSDALEAAGRREGGGYLREAFEVLSREPSFGVAGVDLSNLGSGLNSQGAIGAFNTLSTGHKIVLNIVAQLAAHLRTRSLVLIDEPETHLHPPLVASLLRSMQVLLKSHGSFAVIATHSPVVVQELPSQCVRMIERFGNEVSLREPEIETFAENIGSITRHVFSLDNTATDYQGILATMAKKFDTEHIDQMFANGLSVQGRALVENYRRRL
ncbi:AAA family ATPase [Nocardia salmonicida]|uniref:AAA family ATPase n=1 Tax=Nocardia salmonicida TaxID=53431 RepID=UPI0033E49A2C